MILIVDLGMGNLSSVKKKLDELKAPCMISDNPKDLEIATKIILPGVGHFAMAMDRMQDKNWKDLLEKAVFTDKKPILGICLGLQLMTRSSEEGNGEAIEGLGWFDAKVVRFSPEDTLRFKVPHTGWNAVEFKTEYPINKGIENGTEFYFVHAYHVVSDRPEQVLCETTYCYPFVSGLIRDNIMGVQFHPEKSHDQGTQLIRNFLEV
jgi:imidazole glycerol-phosphate synthase subunit HisH